MSDTATVMETPTAPAPADAPLSEAPASAPVANDAPAPQSAPAAPDAPAATPVADDWRAAWAGGDEKVARDLERFTKPEDVYKSWKEATRALHDSGKVKLPGADATDEDRAAFRKLTGIPDDFKAYDIKPELPEGFEFSELDNKILGDVRQRWHQSGDVRALPEVQKALVEEYARMTEEVHAQGMAQAKEHYEATQKWLNENWGPEKDRNLGFAQGALERYDAEGELTGKNGGENLLRKRFEDGTSLGDYVPFVKLLAAIGRDTVDDPLLLEAGRNGGSGVDNLRAQKEAILKLRADGKMTEYAEKQADLDRINDALERATRR